MLRRLGASCAQRLQVTSPDTLQAAQILPFAARVLATTTAAQQAEGVPQARTAPQPREASPAALQGLAAVPSAAKFLGFAGAIPFIALSPPVAAALPLLPYPVVANASLLQITYGASILSFLGGIHWAMAMAEYGGAAVSARVAPERYLWSVTPCLMAWPAVVMETGPGSLVVGACMGLVYLVDRIWASKGLLPQWYMTLRLPLTLLATTGMGITLVDAVQKESAEVAAASAAHSSS